MFVHFLGFVSVFFFCSGQCVLFGFCCGLCGDKNGGCSCCLSVCGAYLIFWEENRLQRGVRIFQISFRIHFCGIFIDLLWGRNRNLAFSYVLWSSIHGRFQVPGNCRMRNCFILAFDLFGRKLLLCLQREFRLLLRLILGSCFG